MNEITALSCLHCSFGEIVTTPDNQEGLRNLIDRFKICPQCKGNKIVQTAWRDEYGTLTNCL